MTTLPGCKCVERYGPRLDPERGQTGACCKAERIAFTNDYVHEGPCCSNPLCGECCSALVDVRIVAERLLLRAAAQRIVTVVECGAVITREHVQALREAIEWADGR